MKKDEAQAWMERLAGIAAPLEARLGGAKLRGCDRLRHDEVDGEARWAARWGLEGWPFEPGTEGRPPRAGLRWEVWLRPGKAADLPVSLLLVCDGEEALASLRAALAPVWHDLVRGGKTAGRYKPLAEVEPLAVRLDREATGIGRQVTPRADRVDQAFAQLLLDTARVVEAAVTGWQAQGSDAAFTEAALDPFAALRKRFSGT